MKISPFRFLMIFNYGITWLGVIRIGIAVFCLLFIPRILSSDESVVLKIVLLVILALCVFGCLATGLPNIKEGYRCYKSYEVERQYQLKANKKE